MSEQDLGAGNAPSALGGTYEVMLQPQGPWLQSARLVRVEFLVQSAQGARRGIMALLPAWTPYWDCTLRYLVGGYWLTRRTRQPFPADTADDALWLFVKEARDRGLTLEDQAFTDPEQVERPQSAGSAIAAKGMRVYREALREEQRTGGRHRLSPMDPSPEQGS